VHDSICFVTVTKVIKTDRIVRGGCDARGDDVGVDETPRSWAHRSPLSHLINVLINIIIDTINNYNYLIMFFK